MLGASCMSFTKKLESREDVERHVGAALRRREDRQKRATVAPPPKETPDQYLAWLTSTEEEKTAALKEMAVDRYVAVGIPKDIAEKLHLDWKSELRDCAMKLTQAQFNFVINCNF